MQGVAGTVVRRFCFVWRSAAIDKAELQAILVVFFLGWVLVCLRAAAGGSCCFGGAWKTEAISSKGASG